MLAIVFHCMCDVYAACMLCIQHFEVVLHCLLARLLQVLVATEYSPVRPRFNLPRGVSAALWLGLHALPHLFVRLLVCSTRQCRVPVPRSTARV